MSKRKMLLIAISLTLLIALIGGGAVVWATNASNGEEVLATEEPSWHKPPVAIEPIVVIVADTGIGIPPEQQSRIFDRFYRADSSRSRHGGGAGLELSIAMHIVQLHGGRIEAESTVGAGSTFIVKLPLHRTNNTTTEDNI